MISILPYCMSATLASLLALLDPAGTALPLPPATAQLACLEAAPAATASAAHVPEAILGTWGVGDNDALIQVYKQGNAYFGKVVGLKNLNDPTTGKPKLDKANPDPALRSRPVMGIVILTNLAYDAGENEWGGGRIYDPKGGHSYDCTGWLTNPEGTTLNMRGYWGFMFYTSVWKRVR